jgi:hypothetical protein
VVYKQFPRFASDHRLVLEEKELTSTANMKLLHLLALAFGPILVLAELNAYEILMFYDMYRVDYEKDNTNFKVAKGCDNCNFEKFVIHIDRLGLTTGVDGRFGDLLNPTLDDVENWEGRNDLVYDAKKLLGGLWRDEDTKTRPGHAVVIERLVGHMTSLRSSGDSDRLSRIVTGMQAAQLSRRSGQAKAMIDYINTRLSKNRVGSAKTQSIYWTGGTFDEFDSMATIEGVQTTKPCARKSSLSPSPSTATISKAAAKEILGWEAVIVFRSASSAKGWLSWRCNGELIH